MAPSSAGRTARHRLTALAAPGTATPPAGLADTPMQPPAPASSNGNDATTTRIANRAQTIGKARNT